MRKPILLILYCLVLSIIPLSSSFAVTWAWVNTTSNSCPLVCHEFRQGWEPIQSGTYRASSPFYVCALNAGGEGYRAGYNLPASGVNTCTVGWGGKEINSNQYACLCFK